MIRKLYWTRHSCKKQMWAVIRSCTFCVILCVVDVFKVLRSICVCPYPFFECFLDFLSLVISSYGFFYVFFSDLISFIIIDQVTQLITLITPYCAISQIKRVFKYVHSIYIRCSILRACGRVIIAIDLIWKFPICCCSVVFNNCTNAENLFYKLLYIFFRYPWWAYLS